MAFEYFYLVLIAAVGVIQAAVAYNGLKGVCFFYYKTSAYLFALVTTVPVLISFFYWNSRNPTGVIEGREQFCLFMLAMVAAIGFTTVFSSVWNHWRFRGNEIKGEGFEALRQATFFQALRYGIGEVLKKK